jgi:ketosteroid isomerase-like protein
MTRLSTPLNVEVRRLRSVLRTFAIFALVAAGAASGCRQATDSASADAAAHQAFGAYVTAINSNDLDSLLGMLTEDVVFLCPHEPVLVGKKAVRQWADAYLKAFSIHWEKASLEFVVFGEWAFERYSYKSTDTPKGGGAAVQDTGKGLVIYHHDPDGKWRVARDAWSTDLPVPTR